MSSIHDYTDIINIQRPNLRHQRMPMADRAAQFAPFAALTGFSDIISETGRVTEEKKQLDDQEKKRINRILNYLNEIADRKPFVKICFFQRDNKKDGGKYITFSGNISKIDSYEKCLYTKNNVKIGFEDILNIEII